MHHSETLFKELSRFHQLLHNANIGVSFNWDRVEVHQELFEKWFHEEVPGEGARLKSGIYIIANSAGEVLYIGKATTGNLGAEIWGKFRAPNPGDSPYFAKSPLARWACKENYDYTDIILRGKVQIHAAIIEPKEIASLAEVYLQTWCAQNGGLPPLNNRIG